MLLALDIGNTQIFGGVFAGNKIKFTFRKSSKAPATADELGVFLKSILRENGADPAAVTGIAICCVVPDLIYAVRHCALKYFKMAPFLLEPGVKTGLNVKYKNPAEVGADRIADAVAAVNLYPGKNAVIADFGTATTFSAVTKDRDYLGGAILAGVRTSLEALSEKTAKLFLVEIAKPPELVGRTTAASLQSGLYYGNLAIVKEFSRAIQADYFGGKKAVLIGTGGLSRLFAQEKIFDVIAPDLVLQGLNFAYRMNQPSDL
ncbi:MAG: type III pantothenate kinase [Elusimicrobia bacterium]|nr:type III pantothenate kinase [Elusimicrobiota bacterium]